MRNPTPTSAPRRQPLSRPTVDPLDAHLCYRILEVSRLISHALGLKLAELGVSVAEWLVLCELYETEQTQSVLARKLGFTRGAISKLSDRLAAKQLLARRARSDDRRARPLALTDLGRAMVPSLAALADENELEFFGGLDRNAREVMQSTLRAVVFRSRHRPRPKPRPLEAD
jgi:DNA-binding MarR family transcriptional regulator